MTKYKQGKNIDQELVAYFLLPNNQADTKRLVKNLTGTFGREEISEKKLFKTYSMQNHTNSKKQLTKTSCKA
ncbi:hypothetical protein GEO21_11690 [Sphingobacterium faecium]|uniref:hypothetical protein n=1 Tax=Sphingobacterium faecium TaxID=34087 RepID=UPI001292380B|nr:hypothetical protein [Sphingobacterium faecium]MQP28167.1 hypothetical protein [Sphingobacterium faecium]